MALYQWQTHIFWPGKKWKRKQVVQIQCAALKSVCWKFEDDIVRQISLVHYCCLRCSNECDESSLVGSHKHIRKVQPKKLSSIKFLLLPSTNCVGFDFNESIATASWLPAASFKRFRFTRNESGTFSSSISSSRICFYKINVSVISWLR